MWGVAVGGNMGVEYELHMIGGRRVVTPEFYAVNSTKAKKLCSCPPGFVARGGKIFDRTQTDARLGDLRQHVDLIFKLIDLSQREFIENDDLENLKGSRCTDNPDDIFYFNANITENPAGNFTFNFPFDKRTQLQHFFAKQVVKSNEPYIPTFGYLQDTGLRFTVDVNLLYPFRDLSLRYNLGENVHYYTNGVPKPEVIKAQAEAAGLEGEGLTEFLSKLGIN